MNSRNCHEHSQGLTLIVLWALIIFFNLFIPPTQISGNSQILSETQTSIAFYNNE